VLNQTLSALKLEKHPDKTSIGKAERGFDFLGYHLMKILIGYNSSIRNRLAPKS
jgi:hypothetical protein